ncbi:SDR family oxidoreductase [Haloferula sp. BvORR071]|uniref:SDR family oxidoreductase n=1 Tax=Haloferula sp. BvORR071 TaxID=1396141 RepID=UPI00054FC0ED|nr:SDR family oxidoreductase [Haloferula sp. BvORR071]
MAPKSRSKRVAIVTGAGNGIGEGITKRLAKDGWQVVAADLNSPRKVAGIHPVRCDVRQEADLKELVAATRKNLGRIDAIVSNAGVGEGGLIALTHSLAISMGPEVRVNCISPGWIDVSGKKLKKADHAQHPAGRVGVPEDIAAAAAFLLSAEAGFITGAEFVIDGGMTRKMIYVE